MKINYTKTENLTKSSRQLIKKLLWSEMRLKTLIIVSVVVCFSSLIMGFIIGGLGIYIVDILLMQLFFIYFGVSLSLPRVIQTSLRSTWLYSDGGRLGLFKAVESQYIIRLMLCGIFLALIWIGYWCFYNAKFKIAPEILWVPLWGLFPSVISFYVMFLTYGRFRIEWAQAITFSASVLYIAISLGIFHFGNDYVAIARPYCPREVHAYMDGQSIAAATKEELIQKGIDPLDIVEFKRSCPPPPYALFSGILNLYQPSFGRILWLIPLSVLCCVWIRWAALRHWVRADLVRVSKRVYP